MKRDLFVFIARLITNSIGMYFMIKWFATVAPAEVTVWTALIAGLVFSIVNSVVKPFLKILSLPLILITIGLFVIVINGAMVGLTFWLIPGIQINFWGAIQAGLLMSLLNYLVNLVLVSYNRR
jgi:putative membrane protein